MAGVTPLPGLVTVVTTGGTAVVAIPANPNGGFITNPYSASDQGLGGAEVLYINIIDGATLAGNTNTFALQPGQSWSVVPGQTTVTSVNAPTSGHKFSAVYW